MDILGEIGLRLRAIGDTFQAEAEQVAKKGTENLKVEVPVSVAEPDVAKLKALDDAIANVSAAKTRLAGLKLELKGVTDNLKNAAQAQALTISQPEVFARSFYAQEMPAWKAREKEIRRQIFLEEELAIATRIAAREALKASQTPSVPPGGGGPAGPGGQLGKLGEFARASGRTGGLGGILAVTSRLGLMGFAATTAFSAVGELQKSLRVTGNEAYTATGRIRNFGAELIGGNLVGGIKALFAIRQVKLLGDLPNQIQALKDKTDPLAISEEKLLSVRERGAEAMKMYLIRLQLTGHASEKTAKDLALITEELFKQSKATTASGNALFDYSQKLEKATKDTLRRGVGRGALFQRTGIPAGQSFGSPQAARDAGAANLQVMNTIRASITSRIENDKKRAVQELEDARIIQAQTRNAAMALFGKQGYGAALAAQVQADTAVLEKQRQLTELAKAQRQESQNRNNQIRSAQAALIRDNVARARADLEIAKTVRDQAKTTLDSAKGVEAVNAAWFAYRIAVIGVQAATQASADAVEQAAKEAQALGDSVRVSIANRASTDEAVQQALLKAARVEEKNARAAFDAVRHTKKAAAAYTAWQAAITDRVGIEKSIAATAKAAADAAAESAKNAKEQALANAIATAELAGDIPAQRRAVQAYINYWRGIANDVKKSDEVREAARGQVISLTGTLKSLADTSGFRQAKLANDLAEAELKGLNPQPILNAIVRFAKRAMDLAKQGTAEFETLRGVYLQALQNRKSSNDTLNDLKRANARARAALTESEADDERLIRAEIARLEKKVKATKGLGIVHQRAIQELLAAEGDLKGLVDEIKPTTTVFDLLTKSTQAFAEHAGNVINASNRFNADTFTAGIRGQIGTQPNAAGRARLGMDDNITAVNNNTTALDRNTQAIIAAGRSVGTSGVSTGAVRPPGAIDQGAVVGARYNAMARAYAEHARAARNGIS